MDAKEVESVRIELDHFALGEYGKSISETLLVDDHSLAFRRMFRLFGVYAKSPFALRFPNDPDIPTNWARSSQCWEIHMAPSKQLLETYGAQYSFLEDVSQEWNRPVELLAEYNIAMTLCRRFRPLVCGEAKAIEAQEKIAKELEKSGIGAYPFSLNQGLGAVAATIASYITQQLPELAEHSPIVVGTTILLMCFGQRKLCGIMKEFEATYDSRKDKSLSKEFFVCGSTTTATGRPCGTLVRIPGCRCARHS